MSNVVVSTWTAMVTFSSRKVDPRAYTWIVPVLPSLLSLEEKWGWDFHIPVWDFSLQLSVGQAEAEISILRACEKMWGKACLLKLELTWLEASLGKAFCRCLLNPRDWACTWLLPSYCPYSANSSTLHHERDALSSINPGLLSAPKLCFPGHQVPEGVVCHCLLCATNSVFKTGSQVSPADRPHLANAMVIFTSVSL